MTTPLLIGLVAAAIVVAVLLLMLVRRRGAVPDAAPESDRLDTIAAWPPQPARILSTPERIAYITLTRALPGHMVLAQVPLSRFLKVPKRHSYSEWLRRIGSQSVDLVVCDMASQVIAVVEVLPARTITDERAHKRARRIARSLKAAGIKLHLWTEGLLPSVDAAREAILPKMLSADDPAAPLPAAAAASPRAGPEPSPFDDAERDASQDEFIEFNETPPSTWFDDLDSGPTPLQKPPRR